MHSLDTVTDRRLRFDVSTIELESVRDLAMLSVLEGWSSDCALRYSEKSETTNETY